MVRFGLCLVVFSLLAGCGGGGAAPPAPVFPVSGVVTYKGKPLSGADVTFSSEAANRSAFGRTDDQGRYRLTTFSSNDGAVEGKQSVMISKFVAPVAAVPEPGVESEQYIPPGYGPEEKKPETKPEIPEKYSKPETSGLIAVVNSPGPNEINFELAD
ncbi:MAG: carboxypeptidase regulatory-like domain-containing protein [Planctomycetaceae bacterium]|nr:carboxypeptidase regulatory-like domain-containing protein [Planctomycetaceae bacterium]